MATTLLNPGCDPSCYNCGEDCPQCTDYDVTWHAVVSGLVANEKNYANCDPGNSADLVRRRWGFCDLPTLGSVINASHAIYAALQVGDTVFPGTAVSCKSAKGTKTIDVDGTLYLSALVNNADPKPAFGTFTGYGFTVTMDLELTVYDKCGLRLAALFIQPTGLAYDDTSVTMEVVGNAVPLHMDYVERTSCDLLPLVGDDVWFNSGSFSGNIVRGFKKSDPAGGPWKAGSRYLATLKMTGSSGSQVSASP